MRFRFLSLIFLLLYFFNSCSNGTETNNLSDVDNFKFILYDGLNVSNINAISRNLEDNYKRITGHLEVREMPKVTVKIWADYNNFLNNMENDIGIRYTGATGYVYGPTELRLYFNNQVSESAVHEFAHLVSMQVNSTVANNPRWLWEAVALYETGQFVNPSSLPYMVSGNFPTLNELNTDYNSSNHSIYSVGYVLLEYLIDKWGMDSVINLIKNNGSIAGVLGITTQEFEYGWHEFVQVKYLK